MSSSPPINAKRTKKLKKSEKRDVPKNLLLSPGLVEDECSEADNYFNDIGIPNILKDILGV